MTPPEWAVLSGYPPQQADPFSQAEETLQEAQQFEPNPPLDGPPDTGPLEWADQSQFLMEGAPGRKEFEKTRQFRRLSADEYDRRRRHHQIRARNEEYDWIGKSGLPGGRLRRAAEKLPYSGGHAGNRLMETALAAQDMNDGVLTEDGARLLGEFFAETERHGDLHWLDKATELALDMPGYFVEIGTSFGGFAAVNRGTQRLLLRQLRKMGVRALKEKAAGVAKRKLLPKLAIKAAGFAAGAGMLTALNPQLIAEQTGERALHHSLKGDEEAFVKAAWQGPLGAYFELGSEMTGGFGLGRAVGVLAKKTGISKMMEAAAHRWLILNPRSRLGHFLAYKNKVGWHGILEEVEEERLVDVARGLAGIDDDFGTTGRLFSADPKERSEAWGQIGVEVAAFAMVGGGMSAPKGLAALRKAPIEKMEAFAKNPSRTKWNSIERVYRDNTEEEDGKPNPMRPMPYIGETVEIPSEETIDLDEEKWVLEEQELDPKKSHHRKWLARNWIGPLAESQLEGQRQRHKDFFEKGEQPVEGVPTPGEGEFEAPGEIDLGEDVEDLGEESTTSPEVVANVKEFFTEELARKRLIEKHGTDIVNDIENIIDSVVAVNDQLDLNELFQSVHKEMERISEEGEEVQEVEEEEAEAPFEVDEPILFGPKNVPGVVTKTEGLPGGRVQVSLNEGEPVEIEAAALTRPETEDAPEEPPLVQRPPPDAPEMLTEEAVLEEAKGLLGENEAAWGVVDGLARGQKYESAEDLASDARDVAADVEPVEEPPLAVVDLTDKQLGVVSRAIHDIFRFTEGAGTGAAPVYDREARTLTLPLQFDPAVIANFLNAISETGVGTKQVKNAVIKRVLNALKEADTEGLGLVEKVEASRKAKAAPTAPTAPERTIQIFPEEGVKLTPQQGQYLRGDDFKDKDEFGFVAVDNLKKDGTVNKTHPVKVVLRQSVADARGPARQSGLEAEYLWTVAQAMREFIDALDDFELGRNIAKKLEPYSVPSQPAAEPEAAPEAADQGAKTQTEENRDGDEVQITAPDVESINNQTWYHGGANEIETLQSSHTAIESLYGLGVYTTDDESVAKGYSRGRSVYTARVTLNKVLDLNEPLPKDAADAIRDSLPEEVRALPLDFGEKVLGPDAVTGIQIWEALRRNVETVSHQQGWSRDEFVQMFQEIESSLREIGYDAMTHIGGWKAGKGKKPHRVLILLDPAVDGGGVDRHGNEIYEKLDVRLGEDAPEAAVSELPDIEMTEGKRTTVIVPGTDQKHDAVYALVELDDLIPSHQVKPGGQGFKPTFTRDPRSTHQPRDYDLEGEQAKVVDIAENMNPSYLISDFPDATAGPPVIARDGVVINGNGRVMGLQLASGSWGTPLSDESAENMDVYTEHLTDSLEMFGLWDQTDPANWKSTDQPVLVRVVEMDSRSLEAEEFASSGQYGATMEQDPQADAAQMAKAVGMGKFINMMRGIEGDTLAGFLKTKDGKDFLGAVEDAMAKPLRPRYFDAETGDLTEAGRDLIRNMVLSELFDINALRMLNQEGTRKLAISLEQALPELVLIKSRRPEADLTAALAEAATFIRNHKNQTDTRGHAAEFIASQPLPGFGDPVHEISPEGHMMLDLLIELGGSPRKFRQAISGIQADLFGQKGSLFAADQGLSVPEVISASLKGGNNPVPVEVREGARFGGSYTPATKTAELEEAHQQQQQEEVVEAQEDDRNVADRLYDHISQYLDEQDEDGTTLERLQDEYTGVTDLREALKDWHQDWEGGGIVPDAVELIKTAQRIVQIDPESREFFAEVLDEDMLEEGETVEEADSVSNTEAVEEQQASELLVSMKTAHVREKALLEELEGIVEPEPAAEAAAEDTGATARVIAFEEELEKELDQVEAGKVRTGIHKWRATAAEKLIEKLGAWINEPGRQLREEGVNYWGLFNQAAERIYKEKKISPAKAADLVKRAWDNSEVPEGSGQRGHRTDLRPAAAPTVDEVDLRRRIGRLKVHRYLARRRLSEAGWDHSRIMDGFAEADTEGEEAADAMEESMPAMTEDEATEVFNALLSMEEDDAVHQMLELDRFGIESSEIMTTYPSIEYISRETPLVFIPLEGVDQGELEEHLQEQALVFPVTTAVWEEECLVCMSWQASEKMEEEVFGEGVEPEEMDEETYQNEITGPIEEAIGEKLGVEDDVDFDEISGVDEDPGQTAGHPGEPMPPGATEGHHGFWTVEDPKGATGRPQAIWKIIRRLGDLPRLFGYKGLTAFPIIVGGLRSTKALGEHYWQELMIKIRDADNLLTAAHEIGHALEVLLFGNGLTESPATGRITRETPWTAARVRATTGSGRLRIPRVPQVDRRRYGRSSAGWATFRGCSATRA